MSKYGNKKTVVDGITFDSAKESRRWSDLCLLQRAGKIKGLARQVPYPLIVNGVTVAKLVADFIYYDNDKPGEPLVVEDTKSDFTRKLPMWRLKSKMFAAQYGFPVREV